MNRTVLSGILFLVSMVTSLISSAGEPLSVGEILKKCKASYARVNDYTCLLHRKDLVNGVLKEHATVLFKFKRPSRFYMRWPKDKIEAIYADGKYNNKMVIHGGLLFKFMSIAVKPEAALKYNRHTIREADIGHILTLFETNYVKSRTDPDATILFEDEEMLGNRNTWRFKAVFPADRDYYGHVITIHIDKELFLPIKIVVYGWKGELFEQYYYEDLKVNVGLTEEDFNVNNSKSLFKVGY
ncbi:MAG TPA: hypothetical protein DCO77_05490 [Nitrospiraceae bacterium]|nr:hypothetical protein [Nitrospiraceae bacterium]